MKELKFEDHLKKNPDFAKGNTLNISKVDQYQDRFKKKFGQQDKAFLKEVITELPVKLNENQIDRFISIADSGLNYSEYAMIRCGVVDEVPEEFSFYEEDIYSVMFTRLLDHEDVLPHRDPIRGSVIYVPLCKPLMKYAPLEIYHKDKIIAIGKQDVGKAFVWNTRKTHAVFNRGNGTRYNLQLNMKLTYDEFLEKYVS